MHFMCRSSHGNLSPRQWRSHRGFAMIKTLLATEPKPQVIVEYDTESRKISIITMYPLQWSGEKKVTIPPEAIDELVEALFAAELLFKGCGQ